VTYEANYGRRHEVLKFYDSWCVLSTQRNTHGNASQAGLCRQDTGTHAHISKEPTFQSHGTLIDEKSRNLAAEDHFLGRMHAP